MITTVAGPQHNTRTYPKLMVCTAKGSDGGMIVLMASSCKGTVLHSPSGCEKPQGYYSDGWYANLFTDYNGSITLEN